MISATDQGSGVQNLWYRLFPQGTTPPSYMPVIGSRFTSTLKGADGPYLVDFYATDNAGNEETTRILHLVYLDNTAPVITFNQPAATQYPRNTMLTLNYSVTDEPGSDVQSFTPLMDNNATINGHGLQSGQIINLSTDLSRGPHTFTINAVDNLGNAGSSSVTFTIVHPQRQH